LTLAVGYLLGDKIVVELHVFYNLLGHKMLIKLRVFWRTMYVRQR